MPGVFHDTETPQPIVIDTVDILRMWERLEESYGSLQPSDKEWLAQNAEPFGRDVKFPGFDGNNEGSHISAASFLIDDVKQPILNKVSNTRISHVRDVL